MYVCKKFWSKSAEFSAAVVRLYGLCLCVVCYMFYLESFVPFLNFTSSYPVLPIFEIILLPLTVSPKCIINLFCQCSNEGVNCLEYGGLRQGIWQNEACHEKTCLWGL